MTLYTIWEHKPLKSRSLSEGVEEPKFANGTPQEPYNQRIGVLYAVDEDDASIKWHMYLNNADRLIPLHSEEVKLGRSIIYYLLTPEEQWAEDKHLGILDHEFAIL